MGVWGHGPDPTRIDVEGIAEAMRPVLYAWMTGRVQILDPKRQTAAAYVPTADTGGTVAPTLVLDSGVDGALIQPIRSPTRIDVGAQATGILGVRFQIRRDIAPEVGQKLRGGLIVKVLDGGNDTQLTLSTFSLTETIDSSLAWGRIYDAVVITGGV